jgi:hypothetical protein
MYLTTLSRPPSISELKEVMKWVESPSMKLRTEEPTGKDYIVSENSEFKNWKDLAHVLLNTNDFMFIR